MCAKDFELEEIHESPTVVFSSPRLSQGLTADEDRLVVFTCALAASAAPELLAQVAPERASMLEAQAAALLRFERRDRIAGFSRKFAPVAPPQAVRSLAQLLDGEPLWFAAAVCQRAAPEVRDRLLAIPSVRDAWRQGSAVHPALANYAFRFAARVLNG